MSVLASAPNISLEDAEGLGITYDIVEGERVELRMGVFEMSVSNILENDLSGFCRAGELGRTFVEMKYRMRPNDPITIPDVSFVSFRNWPKRRGLPRKAEAWHVVADLAVEVISPNDKMTEAILKLYRYFEAGVQSVWHVLPFVESVYVYESPKKVNVFSMSDDLECAGLFPGWKLPVATLFPAETDE